MNIVPIKIDVKSLYENRHLFTDDVHYNSLVTSILINEPIKLVSLEYFINLDVSVKEKIIHDTLSFNYILDKDGLYIDVGFFIPWDEYASYYQGGYEDKEPRSLNILICLSE